jgi:hypothetical protein
MYINPKGMIDMPITNRYVWGHAYEHDKITSKHSYLSKVAWQYQEHN